MPAEILIADAVEGQLMQGLSALGLRYEYAPEISKTELLSQMKGKEGLVIRSKCPINQTFLDQAPDLRWIARAGAGLDLIDLPACQARDITVFAANEGNQDAVAEHVMGQLLSLSSKLQQADAQVRQGIWDREGNRGWELHGKSLGIIGYGHMGQALAQRLQGFGMKVLIYDKYHPAKDGVTLEQLFEEADILSLHIPLTAETRGMVNQAFLAQFKKPLVLINSSRGEICVLPALAEALERGQLKGLALDVLPNEKPGTWTAQEKAEFEAIARFPQTIFSPHVAGWTKESYEKISLVLLKKIAAFYGQLPR